MKAEGFHPDETLATRYILEGVSFLFGGMLSSEKSCCHICLAEKKQ